MVNTVSDQRIGGLHTVRALMDDGSTLGVSAGGGSIPEGITDSNSSELIRVDVCVTVIGTRAVEAAGWCM